MKFLSLITILVTTSLTTAQARYDQGNFELSFSSKNYQCDELLSKSDKEEQLENIKQEHIDAQKELKIKKATYQATRVNSKSFTDAAQYAAYHEQAQREMLSLQEYQNELKKGLAQFSKCSTKSEEEIKTLKLVLAEEEAKKKEEAAEKKFEDNKAKISAQISGWIQESQIKSKNTCGFQVNSNYLENLQAKLERYDLIKKYLGKNAADKYIYQTGGMPTLVLEKGLDVNFGQNLAQLSNVELLELYVYSFTNYKTKLKVSDKKSKIISYGSSGLIFKFYRSFDFDGVINLEITSEELGIVIDVKMDEKKTWSKTFQELARMGIKIRTSAQSDVCGNDSLIEKIAEATQSSPDLRSAQFDLDRSNDEKNQSINKSTVTPVVNSAKAIDV